jgi:hypothetical protein
VQRVDLSQPANANATTILTGLVSCDPIRRTPWGSLIAGEESTDGGTYEIMDPLSIATPIAVTNRATGTTTDPRVVKFDASSVRATRTTCTHPSLCGPGPQPSGPGATRQIASAALALIDRP